MGAGSVPSSLPVVLCHGEWYAQWVTAMLSEGKPFDGEIMAYDEKLALRVREELAGQAKYVEKKMFGGLCFLLDGNMCCRVMGEEIIVRVGADNYIESLKRPHAKEMDFTGRPMRGMVVVEAAGIDSATGLSEWLSRGVKFARSLPAK